MKQRDTITGLSVRGFKSIADEQYLDIRPLTVLAGANSSGKSSFMQPLLLLKQTLESPGDPGALWLGGANVKFTSAEQLLSHASKNGRDFSVGLFIGEDLHLTMTYTYAKDDGFSAGKMEVSLNDQKFTLRASMTHDDIVDALPSSFDDIRKDIIKQSKNDVKWIVERDRCFLTLRVKRDSRPFFWFNPEDILPLRSFYSLIQNVIHLPGLRGNPQRDYARQAVGRRFPGTFDTYVASVIEQWQKNKSTNLKLLGTALENMGLTWKVKAAPLNDTTMELKVGRLPHSRRGGASDLVSIADVGFGVSQSLPVIVSLLAAKPGQLLYLEQPEIHLHPLAQRKLARELAAASKRGVIVVVETHSSLLLREIQTLIALDEVKPHEVALHWFSRNADGMTTVQTAKLDKNGSFGSWPVDFDETDMASEDAYLDAVEARRKSHAK